MTIEAASLLKDGDLLTALLMVGAVLSHFRVRDPLIKAAPAFIMLVLSSVVILSYMA